MTLKKTKTLIVLLNKSIIEDSLLGKTGKITQIVKTNNQTYIDVDIVDYALIKLTDLNEDHASRLEGASIVFGDTQTDEGFVSTVITLSSKPKKVEKKDTPVVSRPVTNSPTKMPTERFY
jgi:hypothetical protein